MSDIVIRAESLGKKYIIGHETQRESYTTLCDVIARGAHNLLRKARDMVHGRPIIEGDELEEVGALREVKRVEFNLNRCGLARCSLFDPRCWM